MGKAQAKSRTAYHVIGYTPAASRSREALHALLARQWYSERSGQ